MELEESGGFQTSRDSVSPPPSRTMIVILDTPLKRTGGEKSMEDSGGGFSEPIGGGGW